MQLVIFNTTSSPKTYLSGNVTVAANGSTNVVNVNYILQLTIDGQLRNDILTSAVYITDGVNNFGNVDAINYLYELVKNIGPISDSNGSSLTSTAGSLNVNVTNSSNITIANTNYYVEVTSVATAVPTTILTYTVPSTPNGFYFSLVEVSGTQVADFRVYVDGTRVARKYTYYGNGFNTEFDFLGFKLNVGQVITVEVLNSQSTIGDFNSRIVGSLI